MFDLYSNLSAPKAVGTGAATEQTSIDAKPATTPVAAAPASSSSSSSTGTTSGWSSTTANNIPTAMAQSLLLKRKRQQQQPAKLLTPRSAMAIVQAKIKEEIIMPHDQPVVTISSNSPTKIQHPLADDPHSGGGKHHQATGSLLGVKEVDEYDPTRPNDYEEYCNERQARAMEYERERERQRELRELEREQMRERERERERDRHDRGYMEEDNYPPRAHNAYSPPRQLARESPPPAAPAPGKIDLNISGEEAWRRRAQLSAAVAPAPSMAPAMVHDPYGYDSEDLPTRPPPGPRVSAHIPPPSYDNPPPSSAPTPTKSGGGLSVAEQMMKKMGWKEGQGLGREGQGIVNPLEHKKVSKGKGPASGVIVDTNSVGGPSKRRKVESSKVILLRNMVGPGEVDEDLASETAEECAKFGPVVRCKIYEEQNPMVPPDKAVRIFVQFTALDGAVKAINGLNGRFFAKRQVEAIFFDEERWVQGDLASHPDEY